jgi:hypothetical protein
VRTHPYLISLLRQFLDALSFLFHFFFNGIREGSTSAPSCFLRPLLSWSPAWVLPVAALSFRLSVAELVLRRTTACLFPSAPLARRAFPFPFTLLAGRGSNDGLLVDDGLRSSPAGSAAFDLNLVMITRSVGRVGIAEFSTSTGRDSR